MVGVVLGWEPVGGAVDQPGLGSVPPAGPPGALRLKWLVPRPQASECSDSDWGCQRVTPWRASWPRRGCSVLRRVTPSKAAAGMLRLEVAWLLVVDSDDR